MIVLPFIYGQLDFRNHFQFGVERGLNGIVRGKNKFHVREYLITPL